jgi:hypothetical protein
MKVFWHKNENSPQLLLLFNGWGFDPAIFGGVCAEGSDIVSVYDYRTILPEQFDFTRSRSAGTIVAAWSFGVLAADRFAAHIGNVTKAIAVNGSTNPIDDAEGIPRAVFLATLQSFNARNREKFYLRAAGGASALKRMSAKLPDREVAEQRAELEALAELSKTPREGEGLPWDYAVISTGDKIFPVASLRNAWGAKARERDGEHCPDFSTFAL